jgi:MFS transporter, FSR family, fosmidomycin resistance protein
MRVLWVLHILNDGYRTTAVTILPFVARDLSLSLTHVGILGSSQTLIGTLLAIPSAYVAAKIGGYRLLVLSLVLYAAGFMGIGLSARLTGLLLFFYLGAIGFAFFHPVSFALVTRLSEPGKRGKNMGNFMALGDIGRVIIPSVALLVIPSAGWRPVMLILALIALAIYVAARMVTPGDIPIERSAMDAAMGKRNWLKSSLKLLADRRFVWVLLAAVGDTLASSSIYIYLPFLLLALGIEPSRLVLFTGAFFLGSLSGKSLLGRAVDAFGNIRVFMLSEVSMAVLLVLLVSHPPFLMLVLISYFLGAFTKGTSPVVQTLISEVIHEDHFEKAFGASETFIQIAGAVSILVSGILADHYGIGSVFYFSALLAIFAILPLIGLGSRR